MPKAVSDGLLLQSVTFVLQAYYNEAVLGKTFSLRSNTTTRGVQTTVGNVVRSLTIIKAWFQGRY